MPIDVGVFHYTVISTANKVLFLWNWFIVCKQDYSKSYQRIFDEIFWIGVVYSLEEVNKLDNSTKFKAFQIWLFQKKKILFITNYCTLTVKTKDCDNKVNINKTVLFLSVSGCICCFYCVCHFSVLSVNKCVNFC